MQSEGTDRPFKVGENATIILKELPVWQRGNCQEYPIEGVVMARVEALLDRTSDAAELRVVQFAA